MRGACVLFFKARHGRTKDMHIYTYLKIIIIEPHIVVREKENARRFSYFLIEALIISILEAQPLKIIKIDNYIS